VVGRYQLSDSPIPSLGVAPSARTCYTRCGDADVAYLVLGDGSIDLLLYTAGNVPIDCMDEEPSMARFQRQLVSFGRLIRVTDEERACPSEGRHRLPRPKGPASLQKDDPAIHLKVNGRPFDRRGGCPIMGRWTFARAHVAQWRDEGQAAS
jgi:hypothetical protein